MAEKAILILDQSLSSTGFALWDGSDVQSGAWPLCDGIRNRDQGFRALFQKLDAIHKESPLGLIGYEEPFSGPKDTTPKRVALFGLVAIIELFCVSRGIDHRSYPSQSWRGSFFSKEERQALRGSDWKRAAIERARQFGLDPMTDDEAEAFAILDHHLLKHRIIPSWRSRNPVLNPVA